MTNAPSGKIQPPMGEVTRLLGRWRRGDAAALDELTPLVYAELHKLADHYMRHERGDHTLQPTALVNEAYLRLTGVRTPAFENRVHFYGAAATAMRRVLVDHAREHGAAKRGTKARGHRRGRGRADRHATGPASACMTRWTSSRRSHPHPRAWWSCGISAACRSTRRRPSSASRRRPSSGTGRSPGRGCMAR